MQMICICNDTALSGECQALEAGKGKKAAENWKPEKISESLHGKKRDRKGFLNPGKSGVFPGKPAGRGFGFP